LLVLPTSPVAWRVGSGPPHRRAAVLDGSTYDPQTPHERSQGKLQLGCSSTATSAAGPSTEPAAVLLHLDAGVTAPAFGVNLEVLPSDPYRELLEQLHPVCRDPATAMKISGTLHRLPAFDELAVRAVVSLEHGERLIPALRRKPHRDLGSPHYQRAATLLTKAQVLSTIAQAEPTVHLLIRKQVKWACTAATAASPPTYKVLSLLHTKRGALHSQAPGPT
jgi:hypothetical protein